MRRRAGSAVVLGQKDEDEHPHEYRVVYLRWWFNRILPAAVEEVCRQFVWLIFPIQNTWYFAGFCCGKKKAYQQRYCIAFNVFRQHQQPNQAYIQSLQYAVIVVPPRTWRVSALCHSSIALWWVKFLSDRTAWVELTDLDWLSPTRLLFRVQKILRGTHELGYTTSRSDPHSMYWSLRTTLQVFSCRPAGNW